MHTLMWTFKVPAGTSRAQLLETIATTAHTYKGNLWIDPQILRDHT